MRVGYVDAFVMDRASYEDPRNIESYVFASHCCGVAVRSERRGWDEHAYFLRKRITDFAAALSGVPSPGRAGSNGIARLRGDEAMGGRDGEGGERAANAAMVCGSFRGAFCE